MRVYVPSTSATLHELLARGVIAAGDDGIAAFAVTAGLRAWLDGSGGGESADDAEELEYVAQAEAARASLRLLAADPASSRRRAVVAADVADDAVEVVDGTEPGLVRVRHAVAAAAVASVHLDDADAETAVAAAASSVTGADDGDEAAVAVVDAADDHELSWYATQELAGVLAEL